MSKRNIKYRAGVLSLLVIMLFSYFTRPTVGKYVFTATGHAMSSMISGYGFTNTFVIEDDSFGDGNSVTSDNLFGMGITTVDDVATIESYDSNYALESVNDKIFVVQNNSQYDVVACFDIIICLGLTTELARETTLNITITEQSSGVSFTVAAKKDGSVENGQAPLIAHAENEDEVGDVYKEPIINCKYTGKLRVPYRAYSTTINPYEYFMYSHIDENVFESFILVPSGQTKTFVLSVDASDASFWGLDKNAYASMTMTCVKYEKESG